MASSSATAQTTRRPGVPGGRGGVVDRRRVGRGHQLGGAGRRPGHGGERGFPRPAHDEAVDAGGVEGAHGLAEVERVLDAVEDHEQRSLPHLGKQLFDRTLAPLPDQADHAAVGPPGGKLLDPIRVDRVDEHAALARQRSEPSQPSIARPDRPDALHRAHPGLQDGLDRQMALDHEPALVGHLAQRWAEGRRRAAGAAAASSEAIVAGRCPLTWTPPAS